MIFSPLLALLKSPETLIDAPVKMTESAINRAIDAVDSVASFSVTDWLFDALDGWKSWLVDWLTIGGSAGLTGMVTFWIVRKVLRRQLATWLRWQVSQRVGLEAVAQFGDKRVRYHDGVLMVNAWGSGGVARWLQAQGYSQEVAK